VRKLVKADGWVKISQEGSREQYAHPTKPGRVTISGHDRDEAKPGTLASILRQAGLKK
jgi:predicted RNA binding protein YcfA (HicA-like mRNA interferase family)